MQDFHEVSFSNIATLSYDLPVTYSPSYLNVISVQSELHARHVISL